MRCPPRKIRMIGNAQLGQDDHSPSVFIGRCHQRALDVACARGKDLSPFKPGASMPVDQPKPIRVVWFQTPNSLPARASSATSCTRRSFP